MKAFVCSAFLLLGTFFVAHSQQIMFYRLVNSSANDIWTVNLDAGYPAAEATVKPNSTEKGMADIRNMPITYVATSTNGCIATGSIPGPMNWAPASTMTCPNNVTAAVFHMASAVYLWQGIPSIDITLKLN